MMSGATSELLSRAGVDWQEADREPEAMAALAATVQAATGLDNVGVPFCMTVEAEALGSEVTLGSPLFPPRIEREAFQELPTDIPTARGGRLQVVVEAVRILAGQARDVAVVGNVVGPVSLGAMVVAPGRFIRALRRQPEDAGRFLGALTDFLTEFALAQVEAGADVVVVAEPTGTGQILGPSDFQCFVLPFLNGMCAAIRRQGARAVVHICGQIRAIAQQVAMLAADALSVDATTEVEALRRAGCQVPLMGNVSTFLLHHGPAEEIRRAAQRACEQGFAIVAPACGLSGATPTAHLSALVSGAQQQGRRSQDRADHSRPQKDTPKGGENRGTQTA
jgi:[methyl-Co(III) methanol-specific corrinoid protein]:coenzyme M methyltransferase